MASSELKECSASQEHFIDLCRLLGEPMTAEADPVGEWNCFERRAWKDDGGDGWSDVWTRGCFAWEFKGRRADLDAAFAPEAKPVRDDCGVWYDVFTVLVRAGVELGWSGWHGWHGWQCFLRGFDRGNREGSRDHGNCAGCHFLGVADMATIENFVELVPKDLLNESGSVFYSGRAAFSDHNALYILGLNPGGDPVKQKTETVAWHVSKVLNEKADRWSEYSDESWGGAPTGRKGMQPRILHLLRKLRLEPGEVPSSNIVFVRSKGESGIMDRFDDLAKKCWPFHQAVIRDLEPRVILCLGGRAGKFVKGKVRASKLVDCFVETNDRGWKSKCFVNPADLGAPKVIVATHPSRTGWENPAADPSDLVATALGICLAIS